MEAADKPLRDDEVDALLAPLRPYGRLVLGVSGGADSMALLHLASRWNERQTQPAARLIVVTVDHGLRPEAEAEAAMVARQSACLGHAHRTLRWTGPKPATGIQAAAREARYELLYAVAIEAQRAGVAAAVLTAHTLDDQAETLLMRLARGSGVDGLAGIPAVGSIKRLGRHGMVEACPVLRPLLGVSRARLLATLAAQAIPFVEDPSNRDRRFERVRVREVLALLETLGVTPTALARSATRLQSARAALTHAADRLAVRAVRHILNVVHQIDCALLAREPEEIAIRLFRNVLAEAGGAAPPASLAQAEEAWRQLAAAAPAHAAFTLGGCIIEALPRDAPRPAVIHIYREPERDGGLPSICLRPGEGALWDQRFWAEVGSGSPGPVTFGPLGDDWPGLASAHPCLATLALPAAAMRGLPVFREHGRLVAAPLLAELAAERGEAAAAGMLRGPLSPGPPAANAGPTAHFRCWPCRPSTPPDMTDG